jgi:DNA-binding beta-propeller fold protein YncE
MRHMIGLRSNSISVAFSVALTAACGGDGDTSSQPACDDPATLCTWAGTGEPGFDGDGHALRDSMMYWPIDVTFTSDGVGYVLDWNNHAVREVQQDGTLQTVIGTGWVGDGPPDMSDREAPGALGTEIDLNHPTQLLELDSGKLLLVSWHNHKLREYDRETGLAVIVCGSGAGFGGDGEAARGAMLNQPMSMVIDNEGAQFILDMRNQVIRKIDAGGVISTVAGTPQSAGYSGDGGSPLQAEFRFPAGSNPPPGGGLALDGEGRLYVSDTLNHAVRRIDFEADTIETFAGTGEAGYGGDGGPASEAMLDNPRDLQLSPDGRTLYVADELNHRVRAIDIESGEIGTVAGTGEPGYDGEGLAPADSALNRPAGLAFDGDGNLYIADAYNHRIRVFNPSEVP